MTQNRHTAGYARLIMDLAKSDSDGSFQEHLAKRAGPAKELAALLQLAKLNSHARPHP